MSLATILTEPATFDAVAYAQSFVDHGIPVVVCTPHARHHSRCEPTCDRELDQPVGWQTITASECDLSAFRPGVDTLALVGGHGVDVVDIDSKPPTCASPDDLPAFGYFGRHRTPSGGWHYLVRSTGYAKLSPFIVAGKVVGDYAGGTIHGGGRLLAYLPGSTRPKYPNGQYTVEHPVDLAALLDSDPDDDLVAVLVGASARRDTQPGDKAATSAAVTAFLAEHGTVERSCTYGRTAVDGILAAADTAESNALQGGRHGWAVRSCTRLVELMRAGCANASDYEAVSAKLHQIKAEGGTDIDDVMRWALANAKGTSGCGLHNVTPLPGLQVAPAYVDPDTGEILNPPDLEARVFGATPELAYLLHLARAQMVGPWALLGAAIALAVAQTRPFLRIPAFIGTEASLNLFVAIVDASGGGKTIGIDVAAQTIPSANGAARRNPSSGEGIITLFVDVNSKGEQTRTATRVLSVVDEVATLGAQQDRSGSTLASILRSVWSGSAVSTHAADKSRRRDLEAHSYRYVMIAGVQPATATVLLDDMGAGTPQRFLWMPAGDPHAPDHDIPRPAGNPFAAWRLSATGDLVTFPDHVSQLVRDNRRKRLRGDGDALDGHGLLNRLKVAAGLAILHGSTIVDEGLWNVSGDLMRVSDRTREQLVDHSVREAHRAAESRGRMDAVRDDARTGHAVERAVLIVARYIHRHPEGVTRKQAKDAAGKYKPLASEAIGQALARGYIDAVPVPGTSEAGHHYIPGKVTP